MYKKMKKSVCILIIISILSTLFSVAVFATENESVDDSVNAEKPYFEISYSEPIVGQNMVVTVTAKNTVGLTSADLQLSFNADYFEFVDAETGSYIAEDMGYGLCRRSFAYMTSAVEDEIVIFSMRLNVKQAGSTAISVYADSWDGIETPDEARANIDCYVGTHSDTTDFEVQEPTCTQNGYTAGVKCNECDVWIEGHKIIEKKAHSDSNNDGVCDVCNDPIIPVFEYTIDNNEVTITGFATDEYDLNLIIPDTIEGYPVTAIGNEAFMSTKITGVTFSDNVKVIGVAAFGLCENLTSVKFSDSITTIGYEAFAYTYLKDVYITKNISSIGFGAFITYANAETTFAVDENNQFYSNDEYSVLFNKEKTELICYSDSISNGKYIIPDTVEKIGDLAFYGSNITEVTIGKNVKSIGELAFAQCVALKTVTMGDSVEYINRSAFECCESLESINISNNLKEIGDCAFLECKSLKSVDLPESVNTIGNFAFTGCISLEELVVRNSDCVFDEYVLMIGYDENENLIDIPTVLKGYENSTAQKYAQESTEKGYPVKFEALCDHSFGAWVTTIEPTVNSEGEKQRVCTNCGETEIQVIEKLEADDATDTEADTSCSCMCHSDSVFVKFIYKILTFFWSLFGMNENRICECGVAHW